MSELKNMARRLAAKLHHQIAQPDDGAGVPLAGIDVSENKDAENGMHNNHAFLQSLIDNLPVLVYARSMLPNTFGRIVVWNQTAEIVTGYATEKVLSSIDRDIFPARIVDLFQEFDHKMMTDPMVIDTPEVLFERADGGLRYLRIISVPLMDEDDRLEYILGIAEDITGARQQELQLRTKQAELVAANDASPLGIFHTGPDGSCTYVNRTYEEMSGLSRDQALGHGWAQSVHPEDRLKVFQAWGQSSRTDQPYQGTYRFRHADGRIVWASTKVAPIMVDGRVEGYVGSVDDITARRAADQALSDSEQRLRTIADTLPALVAYIDGNQRYRFNNIAYERTYGISRDKIRNKTVRDFLGEEEYRHVEPYIERVLQGERVTFEQEQDADGHYRCDEATYIPQFSEDGNNVVGFHVMIQDITAKKLEEKRLVKLAQIDSLTGLINRTGFQKKLADAMNHSRSTDALIAVLYLDIDHFKQINDSFGHPVGDKLLKAFVTRLSRTLRATDTVARVGGDEFTVIMKNLSRTEDAITITGKIVQAMQAPFFMREENSLSISVSIGLAFYQGDDVDQDALIKQADDMLYLAKQTGRNTYRVAPFSAL